MDDMDERLRQIVTEACRHLPGSTERQRNLTQIIRLTSKKLRKENTPFYEDALQQTWMYFCQNICERNTGKPYDPTRSCVVTWLNAYLKWRLRDFYIDSQKQQAKTFSPQVLMWKSGETYEAVDLVESLEANPDVPSLLEDVRVWAQTDSDGELRSVCIKSHPEVTCQTLILRRLPPETGWKTLAAEFGISVSKLIGFYQRQCIPRLRQFGESEGYL